MSFPWTQERAARVIALAGQGFSSSQIAARLSGEAGQTITRNAVIGLLTRRRVKLRGVQPVKLRTPRAPKPADLPSAKPGGGPAKPGGGQARDRRREDPVRAARNIGVAAAPSTAPRERGPPSAASRPLPPKGAEKRSPSPAPGAREDVGTVVQFPPLPLAGLAWRDCRYILGDPGSGAMADANYCGAEAIEGAPYCSEHDALCYNRSPEARRRARGLS